MTPQPFARTLLLCAALACTSTLFAQADIVIVDAKSQPESLSVGPGGTLYVGSASSPFVLKLTPGATSAETFVDASAEPAGTYFFGILADLGSHTLWTCQLTPVEGGKPRQRHTALRGFDLTTAKPKLRWDLPGDANTCNDLSVGPDHALYITDTANGRIYRLPAGAAAAELFLEHELLKGVDGITFLDGVLYVNNVSTSKIYRIPTGTSERPEAPVEIETDQQLKGPDGMRAGQGKLFVAENGSGRITALTLSGDKAAVTVLKEGLKTPTGVDPAGDTLWFTERALGKVESLPLTK